VALGPFEAGTYQAFLKPSAMAGAQWLADAGGSGEQRTATVLRLTAGQALTAPAQHFGPVGSIGGTITNSANNATASGCVSIPPSVLDVYCITPGGGYRITGLGPYAWPVHFTGYSASPTVWAGNAMSRLDAQLITVPPGQMATYDFVLPQIGSFAVSGPSASTYWRLDAFDAQTGDYAGSVNDYSIGRGPVLLRFNVYSGDGSTVSSCWLWHPQVPGRIASGVFYPGTAGQPAPLKITPGRNCRPEQPPLVLTNGANQMRGQMVSMAGPSQPHGNGPSLSKTASFPTPAPAAVTSQVPAQTFNELVHNSFDAALQLAVGVLP
jgi:hypothetical protein